MASPRKILAQRGLTAHKAMGQNFLADPNAARAIVRKAKIEPGEKVLEIGPGLGALTEPLLEAGGRVTAVELDSGLADYLEEELVPKTSGRLEIIRGDILRADLAALSARSGGPLTLIGNLPYQISSPLLFKILAEKHLISHAVLMFQRELARRLTARPATADYGRITVMLGYFAELETLMELGPELFFPRPKVGSTVVGLKFKPEPHPPLVSDKQFARVVAAGFSRRRKTLKNALGSGFEADRIAAALAETGLDGGRRAETLTVEEFVRLTNALADPGE